MTSAACEAFDQRLDGGEVVRRRVRALGSIEEIGEVRRQRGAPADRPLDGVGELCRMSSAEGDDRMIVTIEPGEQRSRSGSGRRVRIEHHAGQAMDPSDLGERGVVVERRRSEPTRDELGTLNVTGSANISADVT